MFALLKPFSAPQRQYAAQEDNLNYKFAWNLAMATLIGVCAVFGVLFFVQPQYIVSGGAACILSFIFVLAFRYSYNYRRVAFFYSIAATALFAVLMFTQHEILHLVEYVWMFMIVNYAYTLSSRRVGNFILLLCTVIVSIHIVFFLEHNLSEFSKNITPEHILTSALIVLFGFLSFGYITRQHIKIKDLVKSDLKQSNLDLNVQNELIQAQKEEKEVMLMEIHHRVKNNLQVISSLLRLQANQVENEEVNKILQENVSRINSIALIHQKIYQSSNLAKIDYKNYLDDLIKAILATMGSKKEISFSIESDLDNIGNRTTVPMALIFNELITNSVKHAFHDIDDPQINITINKIDEKWFTLNYADNGVWKDKKAKSNSIGLDLIETFTEQLDGTVQLSVDSGKTEYHFKLTIID